LRGKTARRGFEAGLIAPQFASPSTRWNLVVGRGGIEPPTFRFSVIAVDA